MLLLCLPHRSLIDCIAHWHVRGISIDLLQVLMIYVCNLVFLAYSTTDCIIATLFCIQLWMKHWLLKCSAWNKLLVRPVILMCRIWAARFSNSTCRSSHRRPSWLSSSSHRNQRSSKLSRSSGTINKTRFTEDMLEGLIHTADPWRDTFVFPDIRFFSLRF